MPGDTSRIRTEPCPTCGKPVEWTALSRWRPFCSERCKLIDLGKWLDESNRIPGDETPPFGLEQDD
jgi:endogenous inhibitor of DNA gyrase (YacG/DUF329 family)